jgi:hypothetical protein
MSPEAIAVAVARLDTTRSSDREQAWDELRPLGRDVVPYLRRAYPQFRTWQGRVSLVFHAIPHARTSEDAFQLGLAALSDRATLVRYRACGLLAYSLRRDAIEPLETLLDHQDDETAKDARAAILAIRAQDHDLFVDRNLTGRTRWGVTEEDKFDFRDKGFFERLRWRLLALKRR